MCANCGCGVPEDKRDDDRNISWSRVVAVAEANNHTPQETVENIARMAKEQGGS